MNDRLRRFLDSSVCRTLTLGAAALAIAGCQHDKSKVSAPATGQVPVQTATANASSDRQASNRQPSPYHIDADMRPVTTSSVVAQYDVAVLQAVAQRWYRLLDTSPHASANGKVVVEFNIRPDGSVPETRIGENTVDKPLALACQQAVLQTAPFAPWPEGMREALTNTYRSATFTFRFYEHGSR